MFKNIAYIPNDLFAFNQQMDQANFDKLSLYVNQVTNDRRDPIFFETFDGDQFKGNQLALLSELLILVLEQKINQLKKLSEFVQQHIYERLSQFSEEKSKEISEFINQTEFVQSFFNVCEKWIDGQNREFDFSNVDQYGLTDPPELLVSFISSFKDIQATVKQKLSQFVSFGSLIQTIKSLILVSDGNGSFKAVNKFSNLNNRYNKLSEWLNHPDLDPDKDKANNDKILSKIYPDISVKKDDVIEELSQYSHYLIQHKEALAAIPKDSHFVQTIFDQHSSKLCCLLIIDDKVLDSSFLEKTLGMYQFSDTLYCLQHDVYSNTFYIESMTMVECLAQYLKETLLFFSYDDLCDLNIIKQIKTYLSKQNTTLNVSSSVKITNQNLSSEYYQLFLSFNELIKKKVIHPNQIIPWINNLFNGYFKSFIMMMSNFMLNPSEEDLIYFFIPVKLGFLKTQYEDCFSENECTVDVLFQYLLKKQLYVDNIVDDSPSSKDLLKSHICQTYLNDYFRLLKNFEDEMDQLEELLLSKKLNSTLDLSQLTFHERFYLVNQFKALHIFLKILPTDKCSPSLKSYVVDYQEKLGPLLTEIINLVQTSMVSNSSNLLILHKTQCQIIFQKLLNSIKSNHLTLDSSKLHNDEAVNVFLNRLFSINFEFLKRELPCEDFNSKNMSYLHEISIAVTISVFHLFYLRSKPDQSIQLFKDSIKKWLDLYFLDPEFGKLFLVDILDELQFNFEKPAECYFRKLDIIMIRLLDEASVAFLKLLNSVSNQPVNLPSESLNVNELKTEFYELTIVPVEFFDFGKDKNFPFLPKNFQREIGDEWYFINQIRCIYNSKDAFYYGGLDDYKSVHPMKMIWAIVTFAIPLMGNRVNRLFDYLRKFEDSRFDFKAAGTKLDVPVVAKISQEYYLLIEEVHGHIVKFLRNKKTNDISNELKQLKSKCNAQFNLVVDQLMKSVFYLFNDQLQCTSVMFRLLMFPIIFELTTKQNDYSIKLFTDQTDDEINQHLFSYFQFSVHDSSLLYIQLDDDYQDYLVTVLSEAKTNSLWKSVSESINEFIEISILKNGKERYDKRQEAIAVLNEFDDKKEITNSPSKKKKKKKKKPSNGLNQPIHKMIDEFTIEKVSIEPNQSDDQLSQLKASSVGERIEDLKENGAHEQEIDSIIKTSNQSEKQPIQSLKYLIECIDDLILYLSEDGFQPVKSSKKGKVQMIEPDWIEAIKDLTSELNDLTIDISLPDNLSSKVDAVKFLNTLKQSITNQSPNHDSNDDTNELTDSLSQSSKNDTISTLTDSISNAESEISDISSNSFDSNNAQIHSSAFIQSNTLSIDDQHDPFEDIKFGQFAEEVITNDKDVPLDKNNQLNLPIKQPTSPSSQSIALANQSNPSVHPVDTIIYPVRFGLPKDLNQQIVLARMTQTLSTYQSFDIPLSSDIRSILNQWKNKMGTNRIPLDVRNIYCEWLFGAINSIKSINQGSINQEIQRYNQSYTTNFSYLNTVTNATNSYPFSRQFFELSNFYERTCLLPNHHMITNSDTLLIKIIINKSIFILRNMIEKIHQSI